MCYRKILSIFFLAFYCGPLAFAHDSSAPTSIFLNGSKIEDFLARNKNLTEPQLQEAFKKEAGISELTGFSSLVARSLASIGDEPVVRPDNDAICHQARKEKEQWHLDHGGIIPAGFGKIVNYDIHEVSPSDRIWAGRIDLCSWIGNDEYYFEMKFHIDGENPLKAHEKSSDSSDPFPGTLNLTGLGANKQEFIMMMSQWGWKLHAGGDSIEFVTAKMNGQHLNSADPLFQDLSSSCFDMFFAHQPTDQLPHQSGYCMGRCSTEVINTK